ncbi:MAG: hypothetical protein COA74_12715 [Gammaproteobacteria bacterium]|nr:MAG: hypothetical protein COA74_12715 [Gammaproteobacteria bacterium]
MPKYILSTEAQNSLKGIQKFSKENFGKNRTKLYLEELRKQLKALAENPSLGVVREDLKVGFYSHFTGSHTIYYRIPPEYIDIIDVLHQSMDPSRHISN